jgi:hypothetical protein
VCRIATLLMEDDRIWREKRENSEKIWTEQ